MNPRRMLPIALCSGIVAALIWGLWAFPINDSIRAAEPHPLGTTVSVDLQAGSRVGVWTNSVAGDLETLECTFTGAAGERLSAKRAPALEWDDALWWLTSRPHFSQFAAFTAPQSGEFTLSCSDRTGWYDGEFLVAGDSFGNGSIGLGRTGANDFAVGTVLVFGAVVAPLLAILLAVMSAFALLTGKKRDA